MAQKPQVAPTFIVDTIAELRKVTWPSREQTIRLTLVVIVLSLIMGVYLGIIDVLFAKVLEMLTK
jgi:preprotein translocase subunit SecE